MKRSAIIQYQIKISQTSEIFENAIFSDFACFRFEPFWRENIFLVIEFYEKRFYEINKKKLSSLTFFYFDVSFNNFCFFSKKIFCLSRKKSRNLGQNFRKKGPRMPQGSKCGSVVKS